METVQVRIVYDIWDPDERKMVHVDYPLELTREGVVALIQAADEVVLDHGPE